MGSLCCHFFFCCCLRKKVEERDVKKIDSKNKEASSSLDWAKSPLVEDIKFQTESSGSDPTARSDETNDPLKKKPNILSEKVRVRQKTRRRGLSEEVVINEQKKAIRFEDENYEKHKKSEKRSRDKSIEKSKRKSHKISAIDEQSREFQLARKFLDVKGYDVIASIGSGNYAEVYKAYERNRRKTVAVKVIDLRKTNEDYRKNFLPNEVAVMKECRHYNIIKVYQLMQTKNRVIMVMEFAPKGTLADWLRLKGPMTEIVAHTTFCQIVDAIHVLHSNRIAHRDLKLENILLTETYDPKISDFSYSIKYGPNAPLSTSFCGSLPYFSPEILMRRPHNPLLSDIWSLGVCFYIMLNDCLPFKVGDDRRMLSKQLNRDWKLRPQVEKVLSQDLKSMIRKMLEPDVTLRVNAEQLTEDNWIKNY